MSVRNDDRSRLKAIKAAHTVIWAFFVVCIVGIPLASWRGRHAMALGLAAVVLAEVLVLVLNRWRCPLTGVAAQYTNDRRANFDIYLPEWIARHNKLVFGVLYAIGVVYAFARWSAGAN